MKRLWKMILAAPAILLIAAIMLLDVPNWAQLDIEKIESAALSTVFLDADGNEIRGLYAGSSKKYAPLSQMPEALPKAFIAAEDARFYEHGGVDLRRIAGAMLQNIRSLQLKQGASTITQQLIRMTHLSAEKTFSRKAQEAYLALQLEKALSKDEILEAYINISYFGSGAYGAASAAQRYFSKDISELTLAECALLAGLVQAPSAYEPDKNPEKALSRRGYVLRRMLECGFISQEEHDLADAEPLVLKMQANVSTEFGWYLDSAFEEAMDILDIPAEALLSGGYIVETALDPNMQRQANALFAEGGRFPDPAADGTPAQAALIAIEPESGEILCMMGGREYETRRGLNRATSIARQPGSAFKPVSVYAAAVDRDGFVPSSLLQDEQRDFGGGYSPGNAGGKFYGTVTMRTALSKSLNAASVDLLTRTGISPAKDSAEKLGIPLAKSDSGLSLALGALTEGVSSLQLCSAYAAIANEGVRVQAHCVRQIRDHRGEILYEAAPQEVRAMKPESACILTSMLESAVSDGSAKALQQVGYPVAAKTGTVAMDGDGNRDAWITAYTPKIAVCVWMGFDEPDETHCLPEGSGGSAYPARLASAFLSACSDRANAGEFPLAQGLSRVEIDLKALEEAGQVMRACEYTPESLRASEIFIAGHEPTLVSNVWHAPGMVWDLRVVQENGAPMIEFTGEESAGYRVYRETDGIKTLVAEIANESAGLVQMIDQGAESDLSHRYTVVPYNSELAREGIDLCGVECLPVEFRAGSRFWEFFDFTPDSAAATPGEPLFFGIFD